ncbi:TIGR03667 family PPOX class F420-dependent oxidoreductase [Frankia sp. AiPs1]|uniref:TIGR03667 family PPOX class F420-dependent oxidoreductase n=1 Tax=Frankia sp. AiPs1 TaxID=573493 RepID=UPI002044347A|nr:TIGR03667 family PPOX class F420-dependent oxidoreductase [Frankia sp. AiPs1]MCM3922864.1 TIGR03667 family PPOX class F420-dependent oxidoreductase [Frankia sp. AiPs1]
MSVLPDPDTAFGAKVARRLGEDRIAWLTSTDQSGTPQPAPIWFLWDVATDSAQLYSEPTARRLSRIQANPRSSLHLDDDGRGGDFVVLTGVLTTDPQAPPADRNPGYLAKYSEWAQNVFGSVERFATLYSVPLRFRAERTRGQ